jgi:hypothetical protein
MGRRVRKFDRLNIAQILLFLEMYKPTLALTSSFRSG